MTGVQTCALPICAVPNWDKLSECGKGGISVRPKTGDALLFWSMKPDGHLDPLSLHGEFFLQQKSWLLSFLYSFSVTVRYVFTCLRIDRKSVV